MTTKIVNRPEPGFYKIRLGKGRPWVAARIVSRVARDPITGETLDRSPRLILMIAGEEADLQRYWPSLWPIPRDDFDRLVSVLPDNPREPLDPMRSPPAF